MFGVVMPQDTPLLLAGGETKSKETQTEVKEVFPRLDFSNDVLGVIFSFFSPLVDAEVVQEARAHNDYRQLFNSVLWTFFIRREFELPPDCIQQDYVCIGEFKEPVDTFYDRTVLAVVRDIEAQQHKAVFEPKLISAFAQLVRFRATVAIQHILERFPRALAKLFPVNESKDGEIYSGQVPSPEALAEVVKSGDPNLFQLFLNAEADFWVVMQTCLDNSPGKVGSLITRVTALQIAALRGFTDIARLLLAEGGGNKELKESWGLRRMHQFMIDAEFGQEPPLWCALQNGHHGTFKVLIDAGADLKWVGPIGNTIFHRCVAMRPILADEIIIQIFAHLEIYITPEVLTQPNRLGQTIDLYAVHCVAPPAILQRLKACGANFCGIVEGTRENIFHLVAQSKANPEHQKETLTFLFSYSDIVQLRDKPAKNGKTPLCVASDEKNETVVEFLLDIELKQIQGEKISDEFSTAIRTLVRNGDLTSLDKIFSHPNVKQPIKLFFLKNAWFDALNSKDPRMSKFFLKRGVDCGITNAGQNAFHVAPVSVRGVEKLEILIDKGCADKRGRSFPLINDPDDNDGTPLVNAVCFQLAGLMSLLHANGHRYYPGLDAELINLSLCLKTVELLLAAGADASYVARDGTFALERAVSQIAAYEKLKRLAYLAKLETEPNQWWVNENEPIPRIALLLFEHTPKELLDNRVNGFTLFLRALFVRAPMPIVRKFLEEKVDTTAVVTTMPDEGSEWCLLDKFETCNALHLVASCWKDHPQQTELLRLLLNTDLRRFIDALNAMNQTPLLCAVLACNKDAVFVLLEHNANVLHDVSHACDILNTATLKFIEHVSDEDSSFVLLEHNADVSHAGDILNIAILKFIKHVSDEDSSDYLVIIEAIIARLKRIITGDSDRISKERVLQSLNRAAHSLFGGELINDPRAVQIFGRLVDASANILSKEGIERYEKSSEFRDRETKITENGGRAPTLVSRIWTSIMAGAQLDVRFRYGLPYLLVCLEKFTTFNSRDLNQAKKEFNLTDVLFKLCMYLHNFKNEDRDKLRVLLAKVISPLCKLGADALYVDPQYAKDEILGRPPLFRILECNDPLLLRAIIPGLGPVYSPAVDKALKQCLKLLLKQREVYVNYIFIKGQDGVRRRSPLRERVSIILDAMDLTEEFMRPLFEDANSWELNNEDTIGIVNLIVITYYDVKGIAALKGDIQSRVSTETQRLEKRKKEKDSAQEQKSKDSPQKMTQALSEAKREQKVSDISKLSNKAQRIHELWQYIFRKQGDNSLFPISFKELAERNVIFVYLIDCAYRLGGACSVTHVDQWKIIKIGKELTKNSLFHKCRGLLEALTKEDYLKLRSEMNAEISAGVMEYLEFLEANNKFEFAELADMVMQICGTKIGAERMKKVESPAAAALPGMHAPPTSVMCAQAGVQQIQPQLQVPSKQRRKRGNEI